MTSFTQIIERIESIKNLDDNWDGYGACVPSKETIDNILRFINFVEKNKPELLENLYYEDIYPIPYGTIVADFCKNKKCYSMEFGKNKRGAFIYEEN